MVTAPSLARCTLVLGALLIAVGAFTREWLYQAGIAVFLAAAAWILFERRRSR